MLKNTLSLHPSSSSTSTSTMTELIYCKSPPSPFSLSSTLSSPIDEIIPSSNTTLNNHHHTHYSHNHHHHLNSHPTILTTSNRFTFNLTNLFITFVTFFLFSCYFFSVTYHWLNLYPASSTVGASPVSISGSGSYGGGLGLPLGLKFLFLNQEPEMIFSLIDQMQQFGRDHQKSLDYIHVFVTIPLFTCFVLGLWFDSFLMSNYSNNFHHHIYSNNQHSNSSYLMKVGVCFMIGLQLLLSWMEKIMIMVLLEKHPFDVRIIGKNHLMRAVKDVEILNLTSKASFILGFLLVVGGFWSIHHKNKQQQCYQQDSSSLFNHAAYEGANPSSQKGSNFLNFANTRFRSASFAHQQYKDIL